MNAREANIFVKAMVEKMKRCQFECEQMIMFYDIILWLKLGKEAEYIVLTKASDHLLIIEKMRMTDPLRVHTTFILLLQVRDFVDDLGNFKIHISTK
ncbi:hypothetical protein EON65_32495 [archaeon]|nr:MAG: hypothetical protein EON65_32495 [archaeon]